MKPRDLAAEAAQLADRSARDQAGVAQIWQTARRQRALQAVIFLALGAGMATLLPIPQPETRGFLWLFTVVISGIAALGALRAPQHFAPLIDGAARRAIDRQKVTVHEWTVRGVVVAADAGGEGIGWWLFLTPGGGAWLMEELLLGEDPPMAWGQQVRLVVDGLGMALSVETAGPPVPFVDRAVFREEEGPDGGLLLWSPPGPVEAAPAWMEEAALPAAAQERA